MERVAACVWREEVIKKGEINSKFECPSFLVRPVAQRPIL